MWSAVSGGGITPSMMMGVIGVNSEDQGHWRSSLSDKDREVEVNQATVNRVTSVSP